jgi:hypothetical protein
LARSQPGVAGVTPPQLSPNSKAEIAQVFPATGPQDAATITSQHERDGALDGAGGAVAVNHQFLDCHPRPGKTGAGMASKTRVSPAAAWR